MIESIVQKRLGRKYRLALIAIAGRYSEPQMHTLDSNTVLGKQGCASLPWGCSEGQFGHPVRSVPNPQGQQHLKETTMKQLLIALTLVTTFAAPAAMAEGFPNPYQSTQDR